MISYFCIKQLYGTTNVEIPFDKEGVNIFIGENGLGKTTVLNILYYSLTKNFRKLSQYDFDSIEIVSSLGKVELKRENIIKSYYNPDYVKVPINVIEEIINEFPSDEFEELLSTFAQKGMRIESLLNHPYFRSSRIQRKYSMNMLATAFTLLVGEEYSQDIADYKKKLDNIINGQIVLYFPTYRRIEEDLKNLNLEVGEESRRNRSENLIQFGMDDVKKRLKGLQDEIQRLSSIGLSKISSEILSQLIKGAPGVDEFDLGNLKLETVKIILSRVGSALSPEDKERIISKVNNAELEKEDKFLIYFIMKLIEIYGIQEGLDIKIKKFVEVCNRYLSQSGKDIKYNESNVEFYLSSPLFREDKLLNDFLNKLSSGEKQIISLFSKIYLSQSDEKFIVLFDEPELSLSVFWQVLLLPDILNSTKCDTLVAVTHSPFIYDNDLRLHARALSEYIKISR